MNERQMITVIRRKHSTGRRATGSTSKIDLSADYVFTLINDLRSNISPCSYLKMFADDAKTQRIRNRRRLMPIPPEGIGIALREWNSTPMNLM